MTINLLFIIFIIASTCLIFYYTFIFSSILFHKDSKSTKQLPVSIIVCAKNEGSHIKQNIISILNQEYSVFEIVLVNDHSTDDTLSVMHQLKSEYPKKDIEIISLTEGISNKKNALSKGIEIAKYNHVLLTDADCFISSNQWITSMANSFNEKDIILGYGAYEKIEHSFLNKIIRFETLLTAIQYFSYTKKGMTYMAVGRNLAYKKNIFTKNNGFESHQHIKSGDDDLFIQEVSTKSNTSICLNKNSFTISKGPKTYNKWIKQKQRHITTANHYKIAHQFLLGLFYVSTLLFWLSFICLLFDNYSIIIGALFATKTTIQYFIYGKIAKKLNEKDLILAIPFMEISLICFQLYIFGKNCIKKPTNW